MFKPIALLSIGLVALSATSAVAQDATWEYQGQGGFIQRNEIPYQVNWPKI